MTIGLDSRKPGIRSQRGADRYIAPLTTLLRELDGILAGASDAQYVQKPVGVMQGSLGGHVRHCLDHVETLLTGIDAGEMNYDRRARGTAVENDRTAARETIRRLRDRLAEFDDGVADRPVRLTALLTADGGPVQAGSTIGRELIFVLSHTIHHNALVAAMCKTLGISVPARFGYAPATIAHLDGPACVR